MQEHLWDSPRRVLPQCQTWLPFAGPSGPGVSSSPVLPPPESQFSPPPAN